MLPSAGQTQGAHRTLIELLIWVWLINKSVFGLHLKKKHGKKDLNCSRNTVRFKRTNKKQKVTNGSFAPIPLCTNPLLLDECRTCFVLYTTLKMKVMFLKTEIEITAAVS